MSASGRLRRPNKPKPDRPNDPAKDAPFQVDEEDDGDIATPKPDLDEQDVKEQEDRR
jgi:hypothetical protein